MVRNEVGETNRNQTPKGTNVLSVIREFLKNSSKWLWSNFIWLTERNKCIWFRDCIFLFPWLGCIRLSDWRRLQEEGRIQKTRWPLPSFCMKFSQGEFQNSCLILPLLYFKCALYSIWYLICALLSQKRKQIGNKFRWEKLHPDTSSECTHPSHLTPRENSNNVIIWFPFQALCIFIYAK